MELRIGHINLIDSFDVSAYNQYRKQEAISYMTFGEKLLKLRKENGMSQDELAIHISVTRQAISRWENDSSLPDTEKVVLISNLFNVSTDYLLKDDYIIEKHASESSEHTRSNGGTIFVICGVGALIIGVIGLLLHTVSDSIISAMPNTYVVGEGALIPFFRVLPIIGIALILWGIYKSSKSNSQ